ncbi:hypothetical protein E5332_01960 [Enterorhabdus sp. NM05_H27]|nr:hypothetical protein E5332_01960 [Enterorhabdus sp. NM05_H27]
MNMPTTTKSYSCLASVTTRKAGKAMISMSKVYSIRQMRMAGRPIAHIAKTLEISRDAVYKYLEEEDLSRGLRSKRSAGAFLAGTGRRLPHGPRRACAAGTSSGIPPSAYGRGWWKDTMQT